MPGNRHSQAVRDKAFELHAQGLSALAISNKIGNISDAMVLRWLKGITPPIEYGRAIDSLNDQVFTKLTVEKLGIKLKEVQARGAWWYGECSCRKMCVLVPAKGFKPWFNKSFGCICTNMLSERRKILQPKIRKNVFLTLNILIY